jgi:hypothetical protein
MSFSFFSKKRDHISSIFGTPVKKNRVHLFRKNTKQKPSFPSKVVALDVAQDFLNSDNIKVKRRHIPRSMVSYVEKNTRCKFLKRPTFYTYEPKKGHRLRPKKQIGGGWDGASLVCFDKDRRKIHGTVVVLPASHLKDKRVRDNVLLHELVETNIGQQLILSGRPRSQAEINAFEHSKFAMVYEKKDLEKNNMTREDVSRLAKELFNEHMTKKRKK